MISNYNGLNINNILEIYKQIPLTQKNKSKLYESYQNFCINYLKQNFNKKIKIFNKQIIFLTLNLVIRMYLIYWELMNY